MSHRWVVVQVPAPTRPTIDGVVQSFCLRFKITDFGSRSAVIEKLARLAKVIPAACLGSIHISLGHGYKDWGDTGKFFEFLA
jgi:hypothetical protein